MTTLDHDERPAVELHRALKTMGPDTDQAARCIILTATGQLVGAVDLSAADVERLRQAATPVDAADGIDDLDTSDAALVLAAAEAVIAAAELDAMAGPVRPATPARRRRPWCWLRAITRHNAGS